MCNYPNNEGVVSIHLTAQANLAQCVPEFVIEPPLYHMPQQHTLGDLQWIVLVYNVDVDEVDISDDGRHATMLGRLISTTCRILLVLACLGKAAVRWWQVGVGLPTR